MKPYKRSNDADAPYYVQFMIAGERVQYCTGRLDKDEAMAAATAYKLECRAKKHTATIEDVLKIYEASSVGIKPESIKRCVLALKTMLAAGGFDEHSPVSVLTRDLLIKLQEKRLAAHEDKGTAAISCNAITRQARAVFARRIMPSYDHLNLPDIRKWQTHPTLREPRRQYQPPTREAISALIEEAKGLKTTAPGCYAAFLLEIYCGLRAGESAVARWDWVTEGQGIYYLCLPASVTKGNGDRKLPMTAAIYEELKSVAHGDWIIPEDAAWKRKRTVARHLSEWLRPRVAGKKTNHELRKIFGAQVATTQGLFYAQRALGHSDPGLTSRTYSGLTMPIKPVSFESAAAPQLAAAS
jgi:integrase